MPFSDLDSVDSFWFPVSILAICQLLQVLDCKCYWLLVFWISTFFLVLVMTEKWLILALATYKLSSSSSSTTQEGKRMHIGCRALCVWYVPASPICGSTFFSVVVVSSSVSLSRLARQCDFDSVRDNVSLRADRSRSSPRSICTLNSDLCSIES